MASIIYDVIKVGAGCAGLKAAETLSTNGFENILVLEAHDRIGGRIKTVWLNDDKNIPLEMGANWIHGTIVCCFYISGILNDCCCFFIVEQPS
jgi:monoamine oxidase